DAGPPRGHDPAGLRRHRRARRGIKLCARPEHRMTELPQRDPCDLCEGMAGREQAWAVVEEGEHTLTVVNPWQFEVGQCCVITRRHVATLLDLSDGECGEILLAARRVAEALVR